MKYDSAIEQLETGTPTQEALETAADALAFVQGLHQMFADNGMTTKDHPDLNELENLVDAIHGELAAACIFLSEPSFSRAPDMLRAIATKLQATPDEVPAVVVKGYTRLAKRIENTRVQLQSLAPTPVKLTNSP